jgi:hypothetical protein
VNTPRRGGEVPRLGALARWRAEIRAGKRQNTGEHFDALAVGACWELRALELEAAGNHAEARHCMDEAARRMLGYSVEPSAGVAR